MSETLALVIVGGALFGSGTALLLTRPLTRILIGVVILGNGVNLLILASGGAAGEAPLLYAGTEPEEMTDPLPEAFVLTAIVITLAMTAFIATMAYRTWQLMGTDDVQDDIEDVRIALRADYVEERDRLRATFRERREAYREMLRDETREEEAARQNRAYKQLGRARAQYRAARRRARTEMRADRARQARAEENTEEDDLWETILGADR